MRIVIEQPIYVPNLESYDYWDLYNDYTVIAKDDFILDQKVDLGEEGMEEFLNYIWQGYDGGVHICLVRYDMGRYQLELREPVKDD